MSEGVFAVVTTLAIVGLIAAWSVATGRLQVRERRTLVLAGTAVSSLIILASLTFLVPRDVRVVISVAIGLALSGLLIWYAMRDGGAFGTPESRRLVILAIAGVILVVLGVVVDAVR